MSIYVSRVEVEGVEYPDNDYEAIPRMRPAVVHTAHIPGFCTPGNREQTEDEPMAPWLRVSIQTPGAWVDVLLNEEAAGALAADLTAWARTPKLTTP